MLINGNYYYFANTGDGFGLQHIREISEGKVRAEGSHDYGVSDAKGLPRA